MFKKIRNFDIMMKNTLKVKRKKNKKSIVYKKKFYVQKVWVLDLKNK